ncbi:MAG TPA: sigma-70 family RNA polymerase sigma factor [Myxococcota bacterium]|nr:sigma-70 family RNA polymerase sigma factor [Myxococcota bacterium]HRY93261.1 sigma-70 family RNA polymerase sigma factor [Myxococcota bacterium]HSA19957.1 sigma-70 family RNA polymerase sigma factor [Myxococcota bacterium]
MGELDEALGAAWEAGARAWPGVDLPREAFAAWLAARLPPGGQGLAALAALRAPDLYLACAAARGDPAAQRALGGLCAELLRLELPRLGLQAVELDDLLQRVLDKLLVAAPGRAARLEQYAGQGALRSWLRVVARREALDRKALVVREVPWQEESLEDVLGALSAADPELEQLKGQYRQEFKAAFGEAFGALDARERNLLRHLVFDRLSMEQIGALYHVHQSTVSRWLAKVHARLLSGTLRALGGRLRVGRREADSILRLIQSRLEVSMRRLLGDGPTEPD